MVAVSPKNVTGMPLAVRSRSPTSAMIPPAFSRSRRMPDAERAAGQRQDLHPQRFPVGDELLVQRLGFQPLDDGRHRAPAAGHPHPGDVPVAGVGDRQHDTAALRVRFARCARRRWCRRRPRRRPRRGPSPAAGRSPSSTARTSASRPASTAASDAGVDWSPQHPVQVPGQLHDARAATAEGGVGGLPEDPVRRPAPASSSPATSRRRNRGRSVAR